MSRLFDNAATEYLEEDLAPVTAPAFSMAAWFYTDENATQTVIGLVNSGTANDRHLLLIGRGGSNDQISAFTDEGGTSAEGLSSTTFSLNTWNHVAGVWTAGNSRAGFLNGGGKGTNSTNLNPTGINRTSIGRSGDSTPSAYMSGRVAEVGVWDVALADGEIAILALGYSPLLVRKGSLVFYAPLVRTEDIDLVGGFILTPFNTPGVESHTTVLYPTQPITGFAAAAAAAEIPAARPAWNYRLHA